MSQIILGKSMEDMLIALCNFEVLSEFSCFKHCIYDMNVNLHNTIMPSKKKKKKVCPYIFVISSVN